MSVSVVLTIHNKDWLIERVISSIIKNSSEKTKELIIILDGCSDNSESLARNLLKQPKFSVKYFITPDLNEVKSNNIGLRNATGDFCLIIQDDQIINEKKFDKRMSLPFKYLDNLFAVAAWTTHNNLAINGQLITTDLIEGGDRSKFTIRDVVVRGPLMLKHTALKKLHYLDEEFAPTCYDDHDLCYRAYKQFNLICGMYPVNFTSDISWGCSRREGKNIFRQSQLKNASILIHRHGDLMQGKNHNQEIFMDQKILL